MTRYFGATPVTWTWALGTTIEEVLEIPAEYGSLTGAVPRAHIRAGATALTPLLLALGPVAAGATGFVLDEEARTLTLTITAKDSYDLSIAQNVPGTVRGDIELRFGEGDTTIVWPLAEFEATLQDRWTYFFDTDAAG
jgi:hypothetical protein